MERSSLHTHYGYKYYSTSPLKINIRKWEGGGGGPQLLISKITRSVLAYPVPHTQKNAMLIFITSQLYFEYRGIYYTNTISNQITGMYWPLYKSTLSQQVPLTYVTNGIQEFVECCRKRLAHFDLRPNNMLFHELQSYYIFVFLFFCCCYKLFGLFVNINQAY